MRAVLTHERINTIRIPFVFINTINYIKLSLNLTVLISALYINKSVAQVRNDGLITIPIKEVIDEGKNDLKLSNFIKDDIEYIQLETNAYCPIDKNLRLFLNDTVIIAITQKQIFLFERNTGKFIREIGHVGKDPHGYSETLNSKPYSELKNTILTNGWLPNSFLEYDLSGKFISKKTLITSEAITSISNFNDGTTIGYVWNLDGKNKKKLMVFNSVGKEISSFPQNRSFEYDMKKDGIDILPWEGWFYSFNNQINFYELFTDTIYAITPKNLKPRYVLSYGKYQVPYELRYTKKYYSNLSEYYFIRSLYESVGYLFFTFVYNKNYFTGIYDKNKTITKVSQEVENDIDNFVSFQISSINSNEEVIGYQLTYKISEWIQQHPEKVKEFSAKVKNFKSLNSFSNPIVMIAKLKE
jgi:hypothetical protein